MPASVETSIESVAGYLADREKTPEGRLKAAHDWVADRIAYDVPSYRTRRFPPQDAKSVFDARTGVCAGYSALFGALASALGFEVVYVSGDARTEGMDEKGEGHAWNAVRMGDRYVLVDTTWDSGTVKGDTFTKRYITDYYETPPEVFSSNHFPSDARWQLRGEPISRGDFFRQAMMTPRFYAQHRELVSPTRSQVTVRGPLEVLMRAPARLYTSATWSVRGREERTHCEVTRGELVRVTCALPAVGAYTVNLFSNEAEYGTYEFVGEVEANREE
jgi:transglutaminase/protease-like cytokinesis protein 3